MMLEELNSYARDEHIHLEVEDHQYVVHDRTDYLSTSKFVDCFFQPFDADLVISRMRGSRNWRNSEYYGLTDDEIKEQWTEAQRLGTALHECIERWINTHDALGDERQGKGFELFRNFEEQWVMPKGLQPYRTEWAIYDEDCKVAGTLDVLYKEISAGPGAPDRYVLCDWKRSKCIRTANRFEQGNKPCTSNIDNCNYNQYSIKLLMYRYILEKHYGINVTSCYIVVLHPKQDKPIVFEVDYSLEDTLQRMISIREQQIAGGEKYSRGSDGSTMSSLLEQFGSMNMTKGM